MAPATSDGWHELQRASQSECPKVFYNISVGDDNFSLLFTDLVGIWQCLMRKSDILGAAKQQRTSIDPSESNSQLQVLLQKLKQGLGSRENALFRDKDSEKLFLKTRINLPRPLSPLCWTFELTPQDAVELGEQLLRPCLLEASVSQKKLKSLRQVIKDKDHVISRLLEKLEASNTDLSLIFPGVKSRKGRVTVTEAERHVPGMSTFDFETWSSHFYDGNPYANYETKGIDCLVTGCQQCPKHTARQHTEWLVHLPTSADASTVSLTPEVSTISEKSVKRVSGSDESTASEDEFERQSTPPHLRQNQTSKKRKSTSDSSATASDEGENELKKAEKDTHRASRDDPQSSKSRSNHDSPASKHISNRTKKHDTADSTASDTASEDESLNAPSDDNAASRKRNSTDQKIRNQRSSSTSSSGNEKPTATRGPIRKLGMIQRKVQKEKSSDSHSTSTPAGGRHELPETRSGRDISSSSPTSETHRSDLKQSHDDSAVSKSSTIPTRRLGRLGKKTDQAHSDPISSQQKSSSETTTNPDATNKDKPHQHSNLDQTTRSKHKQSSPPPTKIKTEPNDNDNDNDVTTIPSKPDPDPDPSEEKEMTTEEKADLRREELKRRMNSGGGHGGSEIRTGVKKRKF